MIIRMFNHPRLISQNPDDECSVAEPSIGISQDASGLIILVQEGREILVNRATVKELRKALNDQITMFNRSKGGAT